MESSGMEADEPSIFLWQISESPSFWLSWGQTQMTIETKKEAQQDKIELILILI